MVSSPQSQRHVHRRFPGPSSSHIAVKRPKRSPDFTFVIRSSRCDLPPATACSADHSATSRGSGKPSCSLAFQVLVNSTSDVFGDRKPGLFGPDLERRDNRLGQEYVCAFHAHIIPVFSYRSAACRQRSIRLTASQWAKVDVAGLAALRKLIDRWRPK